MQHGAALARASGDPALAEAVASGAHDRLDARLAELVRYAEKLTRHPDAVVEDDVRRLRAHGLDDRAIVDANQVVAYFNYVNRIADGLGVELEAQWPDALRRERGYWSSVEADALPWVDVERMRELDRVAVEEFGLTLERMMEQAGLHLAELAQRLLGGRVSGLDVDVLAGPGGNGGGGLVAARHLANRGANVRVFLSASAEDLSPVTRAQHAILAAAGVECSADAFPRGDSALVLDALLGYSATGPPRGRIAELVAEVGGRRVVALDIPTGLDPRAGAVHAPHVRAEATLTLAAPKAALAAAPEVVGAVYLADLSIPTGAYRRAGIPWERGPFAAEPLVRVAGRSA